LWEKNWDGLAREAGGYGNGTSCKSDLLVKGEKPRGTPGPNKQNQGLLTQHPLSILIDLATLRHSPPFLGTIHDLAAGTTPQRPANGDAAEKDGLSSCTVVEAEIGRLYFLMGPPSR